MKCNKLILLLLLCFSLLLVAGCGAGQAPAAAPESALQFTDMTGAAITLSEPASRIVVLTAADCEILYAIGAGDTVIGRGEYCDYPVEALSVQAVQSGAETNIEQIIQLAPQVVLMGIMDQTQEQVAALQAAGITVVCSSTSNIESVYDDITMIGTLTGKSAEAAALNSEMQATFAHVAEVASQYSAARTVYFEVSPLEYGLWAAGNNTYMTEIAVMLGLENIFTDFDAWWQVSEEQVIERNPDIIVTTGMSYEGQPSPAEEIMSRAGWQNIKAVANGQVYNLSDNELTRPGPRLALGAQMLCDMIYGEDAAQ